MAYGPIVYIPRLTPTANREVSSGTFLLGTNFTGVENFVIKASSDYPRLALDEIQWTNMHGEEETISAAELRRDGDNQTLAQSSHLDGSGRLYEPSILLTDSGGVVGYTVKNTGAVDVRVVDIKIDGRSCSSVFAASHLARCSDLPLRIAPHDRATFTLTLSSDCLAASSKTVVTFIISEEFTNPLEITVENQFTDTVLDVCRTHRDMSMTTTLVWQTLLMTACLLMLVSWWSRCTGRASGKCLHSGDDLGGPDSAQSQSRDRGASRHWVDVRARLVAARKGVAPSKTDRMVGRTLPNLLDVKVSDVAPLYG
jgi:hypothetical protein